MQLSKFLRSFILLIVGSLASVLISCGGDQIDVPDVPLAGKIDGVDWEYKFGNGTPTVDFKYKFLLLSTKELGDDPCAIVSTTNPYLEMILPLGTGSYSLPPSVINTSVKFVHGDGVVLSAVAGFLEIVAIENGRLLGYIEADDGGGNKVLGKFILELC